MIEIILSTRSFDLGSIFNWGKTFDIFNQMTSAKTSDFASRYAAAESAAQTAINDFVNSIK